MSRNKQSQNATKKLNFKLSNMAKKLVCFICILTLVCMLIPSVALAEISSELSTLTTEQTNQSTATSKNEKTDSSRDLNSEKTSENTQNTQKQSSATLSEEEKTAAIASLPASSEVDEKEEGEAYAEGEVIVKFKDSIYSQASTEVLEDALTVKPKEEAEPELIKDNNIAKVEVEEEASVSQAVEELSEDSRVEYVQPNYIYSLIEPDEGDYCGEEDADAALTEENMASLAATTINDPYSISAKQWALHDTNANIFKVWDYVRVNKQFTVAVLDSGIDSDHPDLKDNIVAPKSTVSSSYEPETYDSYEDIQGHGTHCAGIIAAVSNNGTGISGVSYNAKVMPVRTFHKTSNGVAGDTLDIVSGIDYVLSQKDTYNVCAISMSLGYKGTSSSSALSDNDKLLLNTLDESYNSGVLCVCASGNEDAAVCRPACHDNCIAVGAIDEDHIRSTFSDGKRSNYGPELDVVAPGSSIYSTYTSGGYATLSGTSMATPYVAGVVALCKTAKPSATPTEITTAITSTATDLGTTGKDDEYGYGQVNPLAAVKKLNSSLGINISSATSSSLSTVSYSGSAYTPKPTLKYEGRTLQEETDYTLSYENNINAGTATVIVTGKGEFTDTKSIPFTISPLSLTNNTNVTVSVDNQTYTGSALTPNPIVKISGETLTKDKDYTLSYKNNANVGTATVTITGKGNYTGSKSSNFNISAASISSATISSISEQTYTGSAITPKPTVKLNGKPLTLNTDYTLSYSNNINVGTATVTVNGKGNYMGSKSSNFTISNPSISSATISAIGNQTYTGSALTPEPTVKISGKTLTKDVDYTLSYTNNTSIGTATITVTGKSNYTGTKSTTFTIVPKPYSGIEDFVARLYRNALNREPDDSGLQAQVAGLKSGIPPAEIAYNFFNSPEFISYKLSNSEQIERVYKAMFGRSSDSDGKAYWLNYLNNGMSLRSIIAGFSQASEYKKYFTSMGVKADTIGVSENRDKNVGVTSFAFRMYTEVLGRNAEISGLNVQTGALLSGTPCYQIAVNFFCSTEFSKKSYSPKEKIEICYKAILGRSVTAGESSNVDFWINQLNTRGLGFVVKGFCYSDEFEAICQKYGMTSGMR